ncbi:hypothetical protein FC15_GL000400 [Lapidilactobacillus concavus DSM 17758]|uniref:Antitoxin n=1 Tax=Lapidilactobacillus concavus DSM 17758 TaxID=1423735 RepID=A0A0R1VTB2_9LACO|nr:hypothetical protein [Lapidilactobacillus concavus]KRM08661.1 hypothetical protein FC15_GL000400 [Lapidilactobacillus concavus DSM 17758]GEL13118.1 hypothetical protein LCO01nite_06670 [Lapidilactobacillus concavus]
MALMTEMNSSVMTGHDLQEALSQYCEFYNVDPETVVDQALDNFLSEHNQVVVSLVRGYAEMAALNAEICQEYSGCEAKID